MAKHADTVWEVRTSGNNNNGGGWRDYGGGSVDYSQQDAAQLTNGNHSISGSQLTDDDGDGSFTAAMVGSIVNIATVGRYQIVSFIDSDNVGLDAAPGDGSGYTIYVGGGVATPEEIDAGTVVAGNTIYVKSGTYVFGGNVYFSVAGTGALPIKIIGYDTDRSVAPTGNNRPFFNAGVGNILRTADHYDVRNIRLQGETTRVFTAFNITLRNSYVRNDGVAANMEAFYASSYGCLLIDCEFICDNGEAVFIHKNGRAIGCYFHHSVQGVTWSGFGVLVDCIIDTCSLYGISINGDASSVVNCTIYNCGTGYHVLSDENAVILNNQFVNNTIGITANTFTAKMDYNNYFNNGTDVSGGIVKGPNATANDPGFADAPGGDFSDVDDADGFTIRLGVG